MYKLCKTEQSAMRQKSLEEGLLLAMQTQRYEDISVSDLCNHIGVPRKSFYRYFDSKEGALHALMDHRMMLFEDAYFSNDTYKNSVLSLQSFFAFWITQKDLLDALERSGINALLVERAMTHSPGDTFLRASVNQHATESQDEAIRFLVCGLMTMMLRWFKSGFALTPEEMAEKAKGILTVPLLKKL